MISTSRRLLDGLNSWLIFARIFVNFFYKIITISWKIDRYLSCLLRKSQLVENNAVGVFHHCDFNLSSSYYEISSPSANILMWHYSRFLSTSSCRWPTCGSSDFKEDFPSYHPPRKSLALDRGKILILGYIRSPPTLAVYDVAHSFLLGRVFLFTEDETRRHFSYLSGTYRK